MVALVTVATGHALLAPLFGVVAGLAAAVVSRWEARGGTRRSGLLARRLLVALLLLWLAVGLLAATGLLGERARAPLGLTACLVTLGLGALLALPSGRRVRSR